jgi:hypothetical protein
MSAADFGWSDSDIGLIIDRCDKFCLLHANSGGKASEFDALIRHVREFRVIWMTLRKEIQKPGGRIFIDHLPILQTSEACQTFINRFTDASQHSDPRLSISLDNLVTQLDLHTQLLKLYQDLLKQ